MPESSLGYVACQALGCVAEWACGERVPRLRVSSGWLCVWGKCSQWHVAVALWTVYRSLADNEIGDEGAAALAEALKTNSTLTTLDLASAPRHA